MSVGVCVCVFSFLFCRFFFSSCTGTLGPPTKDFTEECGEGEHDAVVCGSMAGREQQQQQQQLAGLALEEEEEEEEGLLVVPTSSSTNFFSGSLSIYICSQNIY